MGDFTVLLLLLLVCSDLSQLLLPLMDMDQSPITLEVLLKCVDFHPPSEIRLMPSMPLVTPLLLLEKVSLSDLLALLVLLFLVLSLLELNKNLLISLSQFNSVDSLSVLCSHTLSLP